jgi:hypothetical protein
MVVWPCSCVPLFACGRRNDRHTSRRHVLLLHGPACPDPRPPLEMPLAEFHRNLPLLLDPPRHATAA